MNKAMRVERQHLPSTSSHDSGPSQSRNLAVDQGHRINFIKKKNLLQGPGGAGHKLKAYLSLTLRQPTVTMREKWYGHAEYEMTLNNQRIRDWANPW